MSSPDLTVETWDADHPRWQDLHALIAELGQVDWVNFRADWHLDSSILAAIRGGQVVGFLRYVIQPIGPEADVPALVLAGKELREAKILAFGVCASERRSGVGRALQLAAIQSARAQDCYQVRSYSGLHLTENHRLKLALGFCAHPVVRQNGEAGVYFILPLREK